MNHQLVNQQKIFIRLVKLCYSVVGINFIFAFVFWIFFSIGSSFNENFAHWIRYIIIPFVVAFMSSVLVHIAVKSARLNSTYKKYLIILLTTVIASSNTFVHDTIFVLLTLLIIPIFISTLFSDIKLTKFSFILSLSLLILSSLNMYFNVVEHSFRKISTEVFVSLAVIAVSYIIAKLLILHNQDQITSLEIMHHDNMNLESKVKLDPLTGIFNKAVFNEFLTKSIEKTKMENTTLVLSIIDIDDFKNINDTYGHAIGDSILRKFSNILMLNQTENIHAFRIGGEEFAIIFNNSNTADALSVYNNINSSIKNDVSNFDVVKFSISGGIAKLDLENLTDFNSLFNAADKALYEAKRNGKNQLVVYKK